MIRILVLIFFLLHYSAQAQFQTPKFVISPFFSVGAYVPNGLTSLNGTEQLKPIFTSINAGNFLINGQEKYVINSTNRLGINVMRNLSRSLGINLGVARTNIVKVFDSPDYYLNLDKNYGKWAYSLSYFSFSTGLTKRFLIKERASNFINGSFIFSPVSIDASQINDSRLKGNGFVFRTTDSQKYDMSVNLELGRDFSVFQKPITLSASFNMPLNTVYTEKIEFYQNRLNTSNAQLKHNSMSFFLTLKYRLNIFSKDKDFFDESVKTREPKVKEEKPEKVKKAKVKKEKEPKVKKPSKKELEEIARKEAALAAAKKREESKKEIVVVKAKPTISSPKKVEPGVKEEPKSNKPTEEIKKEAPVVAEVKKPVSQTKPTVSSPNSNVRKMVFDNKEVKIGEKLVLKNIQFEQSDYELLDEGKKELDKVFSFMTQYPGARIEITGHTSAEGDRNDNLNLSRKRAESCKAYLVKRGVEKSRINAFGLGPDQLLSATQKDLNRRVELRVISLGK